MYKYRISKEKLYIYFENDVEFASFNKDTIKNIVVSTGFRGSVAFLMIGSITVATLDVNQLSSNKNQIEIKEEIIVDPILDSNTESTNDNKNESVIDKDISSGNVEEVNKIKFDLKINSNMLPTSSIKVGGENDIQYIVVHNTANSASAKNEVAYLNSEYNQSYTSYHFAVDENEAWQAVDTNYYAYHAGDTYYNQHSIGVEIARSIHSDTKIRDDATKNGAKLIAKLLLDNNLPVSRLIGHKDASGKFCPHDIYERYGWDNFIDLVKYYYSIY